jgi:hypothetical protein
MAKVYLIWSIMNPVNVFLFTNELGQFFFISQKSMNSSIKWLASLIFKINTSGSPHLLNSTSTYQMKLFFCHSSFLRILLTHLSFKVAFTIFCHFIRRICFYWNLPWMTSSLFQWYITFLHSKIVDQNKLLFYSNHY